ncbi:MAG: hypothetical protein LQ352_004302, partial [Teloschistes flavicans]
MADAAPAIIFGTTAVAGWSADELDEAFLCLQEHKVASLDTARVYKDSEATLGKHKLSGKFEIHTKAPSLSPRCLSRQSILDGIETSLKELDVDTVWLPQMAVKVPTADDRGSKIDLYYLHGPDPTTPIEDTLAGIREVYAAGKFRRFGISNYRPQDVQRIHSIQSAHRSVLPTVYQGCYNAVARHAETDLFPLLRSLHMSFYAYSPIAGGFLAKQSSQLRSSPMADHDHHHHDDDKREKVEGRFGATNMGGDMYRALYCTPALLAALDEWNAIAADAGIEPAALAYRWV